MSDQDSISPYNINTKLNRNVMKIKKNITRGIISWSSIKFSELTSYELYGIQYGKLLIRSMEWKDQVSICKLRDNLCRIPSKPKWNLKNTTTTQSLNNSLLFYMHVRIFTFLKSITYLSTSSSPKENVVRPAISATSWLMKWNTEFLFRNSISRGWCSVE